LGFVHAVIQQAFGWEGFHLHRFTDDHGREWGDPSFLDGEATFTDEEEADLATVLRVEKGVLWYVYDFGDDWRHRIEVEKIMPSQRSDAYPVCTDGRRAAVPAEDIGGIWGLHELVHLVTHPGEEPPEHLEDLVSYLREKGYDPGAFDCAELNARLATMPVREADKPIRTRTRTRRQVQRLTSEDLEFCTCGQCEAGDPVQSVSGGYLTEEVLDEAEVFPAITLPPRAELAAGARRSPLIGDALGLAGWCASGRQVTGKGVLRRAEARQAVEELRLWQRDDALADPGIRAEALAGLRDSDKVLAKRLRRSAHKARGRTKYPGTAQQT
ncbi:MAG: plasmid pRiA4b ORF-3 family protein, partial [Trebonia sp.]